MAPFDRFLSTLPDPLRTATRDVLLSLTHSQRKDLEKLLAPLSGSAHILRDLLDLVRRSWIVGEKHRIAIVGPANVGKSTLYNQLVQRSADQARVSPVPGTTRELQEAGAGLFTVVDTPGADAAGQAGEVGREKAFAAARGADFLVIMFDATHGIRRGDESLYDELVALGKPYLVVLNKVDLVPKHELVAVHSSAAENLGLEDSMLIDAVAKDGVNMDRIVLAVALAEPGLAPAIAEALPEYQARLAWQRIIPSASAAATIALLPLPIADVIPLLGIQIGLVLALARIYGLTVGLSRARELAATFGAGFAARTAFGELSKLGGVPGWLLSASVAAATTVAIGYGASIWFARGERPTRAQLEQMEREVVRHLSEQLADLRVNKPGQGTLRQRVAKALEQLPNRLRHQG